MGSLIIQMCGLLLTVLVSVFSKKISRAIVTGIVIMEIANIVGQGLVAKEGPGLCVGFVLLPILGVLFAYISFKISSYVKTRKERRDNETNGV